MGKPPSDQWINLKDHPVYGGSDSICPANNGDTVNETIGEENKRKQMQEIRSMLTPLGCRMAGLDSWDS